MSAAVVAITPGAPGGAVLRAGSSVRHDESARAATRAAAGPKIRIQRLRAGAILPRYMTPGSAGMDLAYADAKPLEIDPGQRTGVPTGWALELPAGFEAQVRPRSGLAMRAGLTVVNAPGTIDSDYRGEIVVLMVNLGKKAHKIQPGDRVAQLVIAPVIQAEIEEADSLSTTSRGGGGFGHTG